MTTKRKIGIEADGRTTDRGRQTQRTGREIAERRKNEMRGGRARLDLCPKAGRSIHRHAYRCRLEGFGAPSIAGWELIINSSLAGC
jgi:hypothetical protein